MFKWDTYSDVIFLSEKKTYGKEIDAIFSHGVMMMFMRKAIWAIKSSHVIRGLAAQGDIGDFLGAICGKLRAWPKHKK